MKILIIGSGGREHALAWKVAQSASVQTIFVAPGNAGTAQEDKTQNIPIPADDLSALVNFAQQQAIDLTIVGPETPLVMGIVEQFQQVGLPCFGPTSAVAQLEGSKTFAKNFLNRHRIPTAYYASFTEVDAAITYIRQQGTPIVIKADGLAAGKGVVVAFTAEQAIAAVQAMLGNQLFGEAGQRVVIEDYLVGEEASFICMVDGEHILPMATSQDHKARDDGDKGPNTGGMGAYSPAPVITPALHARIMAEIIEPTVRGMAADGYPYTGFLYAGLMIDKQGNPKVLEYNCRLGDPETQPIMLRLQSDLVELCLATLDKRLHKVTTRWDERAALGVVLAAGGYPNDYTKGATIQGLPAANNLAGKIFHAGTVEKAGQILTAGGRVLCACALGETVREAQTQAYRLVKAIHWEGMYYRTDIGYRAL
ncbi:phosphoribosylamine--glycine ligase [Thioploca ingrica]|uniref:Phosphoribosylamine--glycine ligase n=1 Tax=Thioploca ingrica TaxID=40754 RepID=A0A090BU36_9GAMM|nr:phosphoribosylamine--glycine ligase [Thioploca ingrica]